MEVDYTCCECGRSICLFGSHVAPEPPICGACLFTPGWFRIPDVRQLIDPEHDGLEPFERVDDQDAP